MWVNPPRYWYATRQALCGHATYLVGGLRSRFNDDLSPPMAPERGRHYRRTQAHVLEGEDGSVTSGTVQSA